MKVFHVFCKWEYIAPLHRRCWICGKEQMCWVDPMTFISRWTTVPKRSTDKP